MRALRAAILLTVVVLLGCAEEPAQTIPISITDPASELHVQKGIVTFRVSAGGDADDRIELLLDGAVVGDVVRPALTAEWDATPAAEGSYAFVARIWHDGDPYDSAPVTVVVDRTPPAVLSLDTIANAPARGPFYLVFTEDVIVEPGDVQVLRDGVPVEAITPSGQPSISALVYPLLAIAPPSTVTLRVDGATDRAGNPLPPAERNFAVPVWRHRIGSVVAGSSRLNPPAPSIALGDDWLTFGWFQYHAKCQGLAGCTTRGPIGSTPRMASVGDQPVAAFLGSSTTGPVTISSYAPTGLERLAAPYGGSVYMNGLAFAARTPPGGGHDALVTWNTGSNPAGPLDVQAARLTDGKWASLGTIAGSSDAGDLAWSGSAAMAQDGAAYAAIEQAYACGGAVCRHVRVLRSSGSGWTPVGTPRGAQSGSPSLAVDATGTLLLAYTEASSGDVRVETWDGSAWTDLGVVEPDPAEVAHSPSLALDADGRPVVALVSSPVALPESARAWIRRWDGAAWTTAGDAPLNETFPSRAARAPAVAISPNGRVAAVFFEWTGVGDLAATPSTATWDLRVVELNR